MSTILLIWISLFPRSRVRDGSTFCVNSGTAFFTARRRSPQFEAAERAGTPVDLMFVDGPTWETLIDGAREMQLAGEKVLLPHPEHLVALKLHAIRSPTRGKSEVDWEDIRQILRICALDPEEESFRALIFEIWWSRCARKNPPFPSAAIMILRVISNCQFSKHFWLSIGRCGCLGLTPCVLLLLIGNITCAGSIHRRNACAPRIPSHSG